MCKLLILTKTGEVQRTGKLNGLLTHAAGLVGSTELDGFGYALGDRITGKAVIERSLEIGKRFAPDLTFAADGTLTQRKRPAAAPFFITREAAEADDAGLEAISAGPLIMHGRTSTNVGGLINTHPMVNKDVILCHNGVVTYSGPAYKKRTENDSEDLTFAFRKFGLKGAAKRLSGYYAFGALNTTDRTLTVARDAIASLHGAWLPGVDSWCFGTSAKHVLSVAKFLGESLSEADVMEYRKDCYSVFSYEGALISSDAFHSRGYTEREASKAGKSLGRSLSAAGKRSNHSASKYDPWGIEDYDYNTVYGTEYSAANSSIVSELTRPTEGTRDPEWLSFTGQEIRDYLIENQDDDRVAFWFYESAEHDGTLLTWPDFINLSDAEQAQCVIQTVAGNYIDCAPLAASA